MARLDNNSLRRWWSRLVAILTLDGFLRSKSPIVTAAWEFDTFSAIEKFRILIARNPGAILDARSLPLSKDQMKRALQAAWLAEKTTARRDWLETGHFLLSNFQYGVGAPLGPAFPGDSATAIKSAEKYLHFLDVSNKDGQELMLEFAKFKERNGTNIDH
ncbi:MAG TPA: hypothetical protein DDZ81_17740 [Acetobacteraceae bacterium]|jgi:hypothetical protein|nr:hypothetical protein [Acetobacteraceae bacterium]